MQQSKGQLNSQPSPPFPSPGSQLGRNGGEGTKKRRSCQPAKSARNRGGQAASLHILDRIRSQIPMRSRRSSPPPPTHRCRGDRANEAILPQPSHPIPAIPGRAIPSEPFGQGHCCQGTGGTRLVQSAARSGKSQASPGERAGVGMMPCLYQRHPLLDWQLESVD